MSCPDCDLVGSLEHARQTWREVKAVWRESFDRGRDLEHPATGWLGSNARKLLTAPDGRCLHHLWKRKLRLETAWKAGWRDGMYGCGWSAKQCWLVCSTRKLQVYGYPPTPMHLVRQHRNPELTIPC